MKLYSWEIAPNPRRVRIYLAEKGIEVPVEDVGVPGKPILEPAFLSQFGHRRVPLLELDDGTCIGEAMAICRYFEELHPEPPLMGRDARERALVDMWERIAEWEAMHAISEYFRNGRKSFADRGLAGSGKPIAQIPALVERGQSRMLAFYDTMDGELAGRPWLAGIVAVAPHKYLPVGDPEAATCAGVPLATTWPPNCPAPGPRSTAMPRSMKLCTRSSSPDTLALRCGNSPRPSMIARLMNGRYVRLKPSLALNSALTLLRVASTFAKSTSTTLNACGDVAFDITM